MLQPLCLLLDEAHFLGLMIAASRNHLTKGEICGILLVVTSTAQPPIGGPPYHSASRLFPVVRGMWSASLFTGQTGFHVRNGGNQR
jgi:hypothetical protein